MLAAPKPALRQEMSNRTAQKPETPVSSPLDRLSDLLGPDMERVNALIIDRMQSDVAMIPQLAGYLIAAGGKRIRPLLTLAAARLYGDDGPRPYRLAAAVEFIHTATLLHDDVVDESEERRGQPAASLVFGNQASVLVGDFLFSRAFQLMVEDGSLETLRILSDASAIIAQGEVLQLTIAGNLDTTMDDYIRVIKAKTAALFAAACEVGPVVAGADDTAAQAMCAYGMNLGIAFQIADDVLDYSARRAKLGKAVGDDFREGKMTAPVLLALAEADEEERAFWARTVGEHEIRDGDLDHAQSLLQKHDAIGRGLEMARMYADAARSALTPAPEGPIRDLLLETIAYTVERES